MTLLWTIGTLLYAVYVLGRIAFRKAAEARLRGRTSGEILRVQETEIRKPFIGTIRAMHVFVRSDDGAVVMLTNPPYHQIVAGDRVSNGVLVPKVTR
jgi:predicted membrane protein